MDLATGQPYEMEMDDFRILKHEEFISDGEFVNTPEFETFLYQYKGRMIKQKMGNMTEEDTLQILQEEINANKREMTPKRGRQLLKDVGVIIYPGWEMKDVIMFDSFRRK